MIAFARRAALLGVVLVCGTASARSAQVPASPRADLPSSDRARDVASASTERRAALDLDPRTLPRAEAQRWKDYEQLAASDLPPGFGPVQRAIVAQDFVAAIARLHEVLRADPDFPPAWHQLGIAYFRIQRYGDSIVALERYLELAPQRIGDTRALGHDLYSLGRFQEARAHYEHVLAAAPADLEAARGLALALWRVGEIDPALQVLDRLLEREPRHAEAWLAKGMIQFDRELAGEALACARRACELDSFEPRAWFLRARAAAESGASDESRESRARHERLSSLAQACRNLEARIQVTDDPGDLLARLLELRRSIGDRSGALGAARRIVRSSTSSVAAGAAALDELDADPATRADAELGAEQLRALAEGGAEALAAWRALARHYTLTDQTEHSRAVEARIRAAEAQPR